MNKYLVTIISIAVISLISGVVYFTSQEDDSMETSSVETSQTTPNTMNKDSSEIQSGEVAVEISDFDFQTPKLRVKPGTKVTWTNKDDAKHDISPDDDSPNFVGSGKLLAKGESYSFTFNTPGTYPYNCTPHPYMKASVEVVE